MAVADLEFLNNTSHQAVNVLSVGMPCSRYVCLLFVRQMSPFLSRQHDVDT